MFLAIKEIRYSKLRYGLIVGIMFLIAYVVFMLSGLANGLSEEFKKAIDDWDAQEIVLSEDANQVFAASQLTRGDLKYIEGGEKAPNGLYSGALKGKNKENVTVFGTTKEAFILPKHTKR
ncbi:ABC transporter permease, partial [Enterococcus faecium]